MISIQTEKKHNIDDCVDIIKDKQGYFSEFSNRLLEYMDEIREKSELGDVIYGKIPIRRAKKKQLLDRVNEYESFVGNFSQSFGRIQNKLDELKRNIVETNNFEKDLNQAYQNERDNLSLQIADLIKMEQEKRTELSNVTGVSSDHLKRMSSSDDGEFMEEARLSKDERKRIFLKQEEIHQDYINNVEKPMKRVNGEIENLENKHDIARVLLTEVQSIGKKVHTQVHNLYALKDDIMEKYNNLNGELDDFKQKLGYEGKSLFKELCRKGFGLARGAYNRFIERKKGEPEITFPLELDKVKEKKEPSVPLNIEELDVQQYSNEKPKPEVVIPPIKEPDIKPESKVQCNDIDAVHLGLIGRDPIPKPIKPKPLKTYYNGAGPPKPKNEGPIDIQPKPGEKKNFPGLYKPKIKTPRFMAYTRNPTDRFTSTAMNENGTIYNATPVPKRNIRVLNISDKLKDVEIEINECDKLEEIIKYKNNNPYAGTKKIANKFNIENNKVYEVLQDALDKGHRLDRFDQNLLTLDMAKDILKQYSTNKKESVKSIAEKLSCKYNMNISESSIRRIVRRELGDVYRKDGSALAAYKQLS